MRRLLATIGSGLLLLGAPANWAQENVSAADLMKVIQEQNRKIDALTRRLQQLESRPAPVAAGDTSQVKTGLMETNEALAATNKKVDALDQRLILGKGIEGLKLTGDFRVRYEQRDRDIADDNGNASINDGDRSRFRSRFRLGATWTNPSESWELGAGLATGDDNGGRSTNDTWGSATAFEHGDLWLDYAYAKHKWTLFETPVSLALGQQKNPLLGTLLTWDGDIRPVGFTAQWGDPMGKEYSGPFATAGAYVVRYNSGGTVTNNRVDDSWDDSVNLYALQLGYASKGETFDGLGMAGFHMINNAYRNSPAGVYVNSDNPNTTIGNASGDTGYEYLIGELYAEGKTSISGIQLKPYAQVANNFGADGADSQAMGTAGVIDGNNGLIDPADETLAWLLGLDLKRGKWSLGYNYAYVGADAVFGPMRDSDFGETAGLQDTDIRGHKITLAYNPVKNLTLSACYYLLERIEGGDDNDPDSGQADEAQLLQLDAVYKF